MNKFILKNKAKINNDILLYRYENVITKHNIFYCKYL